MLVLPVRQHAPDDGLQHASLPRSFEICVVDGRRGFGNRRLLPAGPLRQSVDRVATVERDDAFLVVTLLTVAIGLFNSRGLYDRPPLDVLRAEV